MENLLNFINTYNNGDLTNLLKFLVPSLAASGLLQTIKHKLQLFEQKYEKILLSLVVVFSAALTAVEKYISHNPDNQLIWHFLVFLSSSMFSYYIATKPIYFKVIVPFLNYLATSKVIKAGSGITPPVAPAAPATGNVSLRS